MFLSIFIPFIVAFLIASLTLFSWLNSTKKGTIFKLNAESLRNPTNAGITVSGFLLPLIIGLLTISEKEKTITQYDNFLLSSIVLLIFSILFALWNNYSLATLTKADGSFEIDRNSNTTFPSFFVFQLTLLFSAIIYLGISGFIRVESKQKEKTISYSQNISSSLFIKKPLIAIKTNQENLLNSWGSPDDTIYNDSIKTLIYNSNNSIISFSVHNDTIVSINQNLLK